jgi:hypothetical protein
VFDSVAPAVAGRHLRSGKIAAVRVLTIAYEHSQRDGSTVHSIDLRAERMGADHPASTIVDYEHVDRAAPEATVLDGYLFAVLTLAMYGCDRIRVLGPVSATALRNAHAYMEAWHSWVPSAYRPVDIEAQRVVDDTDIEREVVASRPRSAVAAFTGGVDSTFTALRHAARTNHPWRHPLTDAVFVHGFDVPLDDHAGFTRQFDHARATLDQLGVQLHVVRTNSRWRSRQDWEHSHGGQLAGVLHQFDDVARVGLVGATETYRRPLLGWGSNPSTDHLLSGGRFGIVHDGAGFARVDKVAAVAADPVARRHLVMCWEGSVRGENCGRCQKCLRTRVAFMAVGHPTPECYAEPFDDSVVERLVIDTRLPYFDMQHCLEYADEHAVTGAWLERLRARLAATQPS